MYNKTKTRIKISRVAVCYTYIAKKNNREGEERETRRVTVSAVYIVRLVVVVVVVGR